MHFAPSAIDEHEAMQKREGVPAATWPLREWTLAQLTRYEA
jgi:hypothetical protein